MTASRDRFDWGPIADETFAAFEDALFGAARFERY